MGKETITTKAAPSAIGPYSQGVCTNGFVFVSGQLPIVPETNELIRNDFRLAVKVSIENLANILKAVGCSLDDVVKTSVYLKSMDNFAVMNEIYSSYFTNNYPSRVCYAVAELPMGAEIEIEAIAVKVK